MPTPHSPHGPHDPHQGLRATPRTSKGPRNSDGGGGFGTFLLAVGTLWAGWWFFIRPTPTTETGAQGSTAAESGSLKDLLQAEPEAPAKPAPVDVGQAGGDPSPTKKAENSAPAAGSASPAMVEATQAPTPQPPTPTAPAKPDYPEKLILDATGATSTVAVATAEQALAAALASGDLAGYAALLERSLKVEILRRPSYATAADYRSLLDNPHFMQAFTRHTFLTSLSEDAVKVLSAHAVGPEPARFILSTPDLMESWLTTVKPEDDQDQALTVWIDLLSEHPESRAKYKELALACALVFEKPKSFKWNDESVTADAEGRFGYYLRHGEAGDLVGKVHQMSARDLVWVVGAPVPESEMEWALKKVNLRQSSWGNSYSMIEYDMEKAVKGTNSYDAYTFAEILKKGGICGDRAYFSANTARACGVPASELSGDGDRGPHAWVVWMADEGKWQTTGRFSGYPMGSARDPQTGRGTTEQEFIWRSEDRHATQAAVVRAARLLWMAGLHQKLAQPQSANAAMELALKLNDRFPPIWVATVQWWLAHKKEAPVDQWKKMIDQLKKDFREDMTLMALARQAEEEAIFPRQDMKTTMKDLRRDARKMENENEEGGATAKAEEQIKPLKRQAGLFITAGNLQGVRDLYKGALNDCSDPAVFKAIAKDLFESIRQDKVLSATACHDMETAWKRNIDKGGDYFDIQSQNSVLAQIASYYAAVGNTEKFDALKKDIERRESKAQRKAI